jgi:hypothetical protein
MIELYPVNTPDGKALNGSIEHMQRLFSLKSGIFVSVGGIST